MKNILVTGGAGFIGSNFIRLLVKHQVELNIVNLDKLTYAGSLKNLVGVNHQFIRGDILDKALVTQIIKNFHIDTIVHFAAESHVDRSIISPYQFIETNVMGTFNLLETARELNVQRFHHVSTDEVYGSLTPYASGFTETSNYDPRSPYSASKAASDHLAKSYYHTYGLPLTISNCSNNYGPYQHSEKLIPTIIRSCLTHQKIPIYGNGSNVRDWLYVEDHCRGILAILQQGKIGECYNIGANNEVSNLQLAKYICNRLDELLPWKHAYATLIEFVSDRPGHDFRYAIDFTKIKTQLDWHPVESFKSGIDKTLHFYINHQYLKKEA